MLMRWPVPCTMPFKTFRLSGIGSSPRDTAKMLLVLTFICGAGTPTFAQAPPPFSQIVMFGDSLSDTGNVRVRTNARTGGVVDYPSRTFNYSNGRFTNDNGTDPSSMT